MQVSKDCQIFLNCANSWLEPKKSTICQLVFRVIVFLLIFSISTATIEQVFSVMKIVKTRLCNIIEDEFLTDSLMLYVKREIAATFSTYSIIDDFRDMKTRKVPF
jgi:transposase